MKYNTTITDAGIPMLYSTINSNQYVTFDKIIILNQNSSKPISQMTTDDFSNGIKFDVNNVETNNGFFTIKSVIENNGIGMDQTAQLIGITGYLSNTTNSEQLIAVSQAVEPFVVEKFTGTTVTLVPSITIGFSNSANINVTVKSGVYVTADELNALADRCKTLENNLNALSNTTYQDYGLIQGNDVKIKDITKSGSYVVNGSNCPDDWPFKGTWGILTVSYSASCLSQIAITDRQTATRYIDSSVHDWQISANQSDLNNLSNNVDNLSNTAFKFIQTLSEQTDLDTITKEGIYDYWGVHFVNGPEDNQAIWGELTVYNRGLVITQQLTDNWGNTFIRTKSGSPQKWSNWEQYSTKSSVDSRFNQIENNKANQSDLNNLSNNVDNLSNTAFKFIQTLSEQTDLDTITKEGIYDYWGVHFVNGPEDNQAIWGELTVYNRGLVITQQLTDNWGNTFIRTKSGSPQKWSNWEQYSTKSSVDSRFNQIENNKANQSDLNNLSNNVDNLSNTAFKFIQTLSEQTDLDTITKEGIYDYWGVHFVNGPEDNQAIWGELTVYNRGLVITQQLTDNWGNTFIRTKSGSPQKWSNWEQYSTKSSVDSRFSDVSNRMDNLASTKASQTDLKKLSDASIGYQGTLGTSTNLDNITKQGIYSIAIKSSYYPGLGNTLFVINAGGAITQIIYSTDDSGNYISTRNKFGNNYAWNNWTTCSTKEDINGLQNQIVQLENNLNSKANQSDIDSNLIRFINTIGTGSDLNTCTQTGHYTLNGYASNQLQNANYIGSGLRLEVMNFADWNIIQTVYSTDYKSNKVYMYVRRYSWGWTDWQQIYTDADDIYRNRGILPNNTQMADLINMKDGYYRIANGNLKGVPSDFNGWGGLEIRHFDADMSVKIYDTGGQEYHCVYASHTQEFLDWKKIS